MVPAVPLWRPRRPGNSPPPLAAQPIDWPLTLDEFRRYAALTAQRVDVMAALRAVLPDVIAPSVERSRSEHGRAEYQRAAMGIRRPVAGI